MNKLVEKFEGKVISLRDENVDCELIINECVERGVIACSEFTKHHIEPVPGLLFNWIVTKYNGNITSIIKARKTNNNKTHRRLTKVIQSLLGQL